MTQSDVAYVAVSVLWIHYTLAIASVESDVYSIIHVWILASVQLTVVVQLGITTMHQ